MGQPVSGHPALLEEKSMAIFAPLEFYRDEYGGKAKIEREANGLWYLDVVDAKGQRIRVHDAFISHKGARIALGKLSRGTMKLKEK